jgi:hypothetical protein
LVTPPKHDSISAAPQIPVSGHLGSIGTLDGKALAKLTATEMRFLSLSNQIVPLHWKARPNPSLKRSANGMPPRPGLWHIVHFHSPGLGVTPPSPA